MFDKQDEWAMEYFRPQRILSCLYAKSMESAKGYFQTYRKARETIVWISMLVETFRRDSRVFPPTEQALRAAMGFDYIRKSLREPYGLVLPQDHA